MLCVPDAILATNLSCPISYELTVVPKRYLIGDPFPADGIAVNTTFLLSSMIVLLRLRVFQRDAMLREWSGTFFLDAIQERTRRILIFTPFERPYVLSELYPSPENRSSAHISSSNHKASMQAACPPRKSWKASLCTAVSVPVTYA